MLSQGNIYCTIEEYVAETDVQLYHLYMRSELVQQNYTVSRAMESLQLPY